MDLVAEQGRRTTFGVTSLLGFLDDLAHARNAFGHGAEEDELAVRVVCDEARERRLPRPWRAPEHPAAGRTALDRGTQWLAFTEELFLTEEVLECLRAHAMRERHMGARFGRE